jgi:hypothetical protein
VIAEWLWAKCYHHTDDSAGIAAGTAELRPVIPLDHDPAHRRVYERLLIARRMPDRPPGSNGGGGGGGGVSEPPVKRQRSGDTPAAATAAVTADMIDGKADGDGDGDVAMGAAASASASSAAAVRTGSGVGVGMVDGVLCSCVGVGMHSRKPLLFDALCAAMAWARASTPCLELFARHLNPHTDSWQVAGPASRMHACLRAHEQLTPFPLRTRMYVFVCACICRGNEPLRYQQLGVFVEPKANASANTPANATAPLPL